MSSSRDAALASPSAIPPRTSSTSHSRSHSASASASATASGTNVLPPPRSVLRPLAESDWLGQKTTAAFSVSAGKQPEYTIMPSQVATAQHTGVNNVSYSHSMATQAPNADRYADEDLNFTMKKTWTESKEHVVRGPFEYVISHPGKDFRAQLINSFNMLLEVPQDSLEIITRVVGMLHESSLLVDDVQDSSELRRGFPVAHSIFGVAQTINSANYIYFVALQELQKLKNLDAISIFADELAYLHRGQGMDLFWRDTLTCPTEEDYLEMVGNKTGGLFRLGIKLMQAESKAKIDCVPLVNIVGLIFQIRDDYLNLSSQEYSDNKGMCEDLTEGKFSFPVIHSVRSNMQNMQLINILKQKTTDVQVKRYAVAYMESTGSFEYTRSVLAVLIDRARKMAMELDGGSGLTKGIQKILDKMVVS